MPFSVDAAPDRSKAGVEIDHIWLQLADPGALGDEKEDKRQLDNS